MRKNGNETNVCQICGRSGSEVELTNAGILRPAIASIIKASYPSWSSDGYICSEDIDRFRYDYVSSLIMEEKGEVTQLEQDVLDSVAKHEILSTRVDQEYESNLTFGQRLSDHIALFGGSWAFIISFGCVLALWIAINSLMILSRPFDPFPYILLNLILSCLAAIQAPIIMMSQNRQESKDRARALHDYQINLKAELEIRQLHQKLDHLLLNQWERLVEIQRVQLELMNEIKGWKGQVQP